MLGGGFEGALDGVAEGVALGEGAGAGLPSRHCVMRVIRAVPSVVHADPQWPFLDALTSSESPILAKLTSRELMIDVNASDAFGCAKPG